MYNSRKRRNTATAGIHSFPYQLVVWHWRPSSTTMVNHKRKNDHSDEVAYTATVKDHWRVVEQQQPDMSWNDLQTELHNLANGINLPRAISADEGDDFASEDEDPILAYLTHQHAKEQTTVDQWVAKELQHAHDIETSLSQELEKAKARSALHQKQSQDLEAQRDQLESELMRLADDLEQLEDLMAQAQKQGDAFRQEASDHVRECSEIELDRKIKETKLRSRIAMYTSCTGIKWNYDAQPEHILEGYVVRDDLWWCQKDAS